MHLNMSVARFSHTLFLPYYLTNNLDIRGIARFLLYTIEFANHSLAETSMWIMVPCLLLRFSQSHNNILLPVLWKNPDS